MTDDSVFGTGDDIPDDPDLDAGPPKEDPPKEDPPKEDPPKDDASKDAGAGGNDGTDPDGNGDPPPEADSPAVPAPPPASTGPGVNSVILDAVKQSNTAVLGAAGNNGAAIAYQKVAQAASFAVQDSTDYLRNIMAMSSAATGVALKKMVETPATAGQYKPVLEAAQAAVTAAQKNFQEVGTAAGKVVGGFPSNS